MNKLADFQVLECTGRWHQSANDPGRDVIVRIDDLILTLIGKDDRAIVTWTCDAIRRINPDGGPAAPAIYSPDSEGQETISITDETMISVLDNIISNFAGPEIKPGVTLRGFLLILGLGAVIVAIIALFSDNLASQLAGLVPAKEPPALSASGFSPVFSITGAGNAHRPASPARSAGWGSAFSRTASSNFML